MKINFAAIGLKPSSGYSDIALEEIGKQFIAVFKISTKNFPPQMSKNSVIYIGFGKFFIDKLYDESTVFPENIFKLLLNTAEKKASLNTFFFPKEKNFWKPDIEKGLEEPISQGLWQSPQDDRKGLQIYRSEMAAFFDFENPSFQLLVCGIFASTFSKLNESQPIPIEQKDDNTEIFKIIINEVNKLDSRLKLPAEPQVNQTQLSLNVLCTPGFTSQNDKNIQEKSWGLGLLNYLSSTSFEDLKRNPHDQEIKNLIQAYRKCEAAEDINNITIGIITEMLNPFLDNLIYACQQNSQACLSLTLDEQFQQIFSTCLFDIAKELPQEEIKEKISSFEAIHEYLHPIVEEIDASVEKLATFTTNIASLFDTLQIQNCTNEILSILQHMLQKAEEQNDTNQINEDNIGERRETSENLVIVLDAYKFMLQQPLPQEHLVLFKTAEKILTKSGDEFDTLATKFKDLTHAPQQSNLPGLKTIRDNLQNLINFLTENRNFLKEKYLGSNPLPHSKAIVLLHKIYTTQINEFYNFKEKVETKIEQTETPQDDEEIFLSEDLMEENSSQASTEPDSSIDEELMDEDTGINAINEDSMEEVPVDDENDRTFQH